MAEAVLAHPQHDDPHLLPVVRMGDSDTPGVEPFDALDPANTDQVIADQREAKDAIRGAIRKLRDKGYSREFCANILSGEYSYIHLLWPPKDRT